MPTPCASGRQDPADGRSYARAFIGKPSLGRLQPVQNVIRRPLKPGPDMPGKLLGDTRHLGGMGLDLMPDADGIRPPSVRLPTSRAVLLTGFGVSRSARLPDGWRATCIPLVPVCS